MHVGAITQRGKKHHQPSSHCFKTITIASKCEPKMTTSVNDLLSQAQRTQQQGQLQQSIDLYQQLLKLEPNHFDALRYTSLLYAQLGDMPNTIKYLNKAIAVKPDDATLYNNLANAYKKSGAFDKAIESYQCAIELDPNYAQAHSNLASIYAIQNQYQKALSHYRSAVHAQPDFIVAHYNLGLLLLNHHVLDAAKVQFMNVLALQADHVDAQFYLGLLYLNEGLLDDAENAFQRVIELKSEHSYALNNLGVIALKRNVGQLAIDFFTKALAFDPTNTDARNNIAATFIHHDRFENALTHYFELLQQDPLNIEYLYNSGVAQMALGHLKEAITLFEYVLTQNKAHFATLNNLAAIQIRLGDRKKAVDLLQQAIQANPLDKSCQFMLHALTGDDKNPEACPDYVSNLFDNYALQYDNHMQNTLKYDLPHAMMRALHQLNRFEFKSTLDLGCGTGLSGSVLRDASQQLTGIDISSKMLAQARNKNIYDTLDESEILSFLKNNTQAYDLIVALDVLPYFGDLHPLFSEIRQHLTGLFVFSCEMSAVEPFYLQETARFCHHSDYIHDVCEQNRMRIIYQEKIKARQQNGLDLHVMMYVVDVVA